MSFSSINPFTNEFIAVYASLSDQQLADALNLAQMRFATWRKVDFPDRAALLHRVSEVLVANRQAYARLISLEMGKPLAESVAEIEKSAWGCRFYAENGADFLKPEVIATEASRSWVVYQPIGAVLGIMPWNFPFWQVFRFAAPALMAGNVCLLKHAPNVWGCAEAIGQVFEEAGFESGIFQHLPIDVAQVPQVIAHPAVRGIALTGSERAGASVAALAGSHIKKTVLELGGSNALVVLQDADLEKAAQVAVLARMMNSGQSCIAAKRLIVVESVAEAFTNKLVSLIGRLQVGDPFAEGTQVGPLARPDLVENLARQVRESVDKGARVAIGGTYQGNLFAPTLLTHVTPDMPAFHEELFGPVASLTVAKDAAHALQLANQTRFGLGLSVFTQHIENAQPFIEEAEDGAVFVNALVKSDPRLPFGGTKASGYGRELSWHGIREFVNVKTVFVA